MNCSNTYGNNVSLFSFPKDPVLRNEWTQQVKRTRTKWTGPTTHSQLCSDHFTSDCFELSISLKNSFGLATKAKRKLKDEAVPTIFPRIEKKPDPKPRKAYLKRERSRVSSIIDFIIVMGFSFSESRCIRDFLVNFLSPCLKPEP